MKKKLFTLSILVAFATGTYSQTVLDTFEEGVVFTANLINHTPNDALVGVDENPNPDATNASEAVLLFARKSTENFWTGMYGDLTEEAKLKTRNHSRLQIKYYRTSEKSTLRIKINGDQVVGEFDPITLPTKVNEWEILEFDYAAKGYSEIQNLDIRPDWCDPAEVENNRRAYVDDLILVGSPKKFDGIIADFETGNGGFFPVENNNITIEVVANTWSNAVNSSNNCLKVTRSASGQAWEGAMKNGFSFNIGTNENDFEFLHFDILKPIISSIGVVIKNDPEADQGSYMDNSLANEWEHIVVDLSQYPGSKNTIFIQPDLAGGAVTLYLDNIRLSKDIALGTSTPSIPLFSVRSALNGIEVCTNGTGVIELYNAQGILIDQQIVTSLITSFAPCQTGVVIVRYTTGNSVESKKIIVQ